MSYCSKIFLFNVGMPVLRIFNMNLTMCICSCIGSAHPWVRGYKSIPLDILVFRSVKSYFCSSTVRRTALKVMDKKFISLDMVACMHLFMPYIYHMNKRGSIKSNEDRNPSFKPWNPARTLLWTNANFFVVWWYYLFY